MSVVSLESPSTALDVIKNVFEFSFFSEERLLFLITFSFVLPNYLKVQA